MTQLRINANYKHGITRIRALIDHPMESGNRTDSRQVTIPRNTIVSLSVTLAEVRVVQAELGTAISKNPYFSFEFAGGKVGDTLHLSWTDSDGKELSRDIIIE